MSVLNELGTKLESDSGVEFQNAPNTWKVPGRRRDVRKTLAAFRPILVFSDTGENVYARLHYNKY